VIFGMDRLNRRAACFCELHAGGPLTEELVHVLPASMTVLEILENLEPTPDLIAACRKLKALGFRLALDDFTFKPKWGPLVELAD